MAEEIYHRGGLGGFFAGVQYAALQSAIEKAVYFYAYSLGRVRRTQGKRHGVGEEGGNV